MKLLSTLAIASLSLLAASALAASHGNRIRGTIHSFNNQHVTIHTRNGGTKKVRLNDDTKYLKVVHSSLSNVDQGDYIGTATKHQNGKLVALEVSIFPKALKGAGEGHYPWDKLPDTTRSGGGTTSSGMTNGSVSSTSMTNGSVSGTSMTNGTVSGSSNNRMMTQSAMTNGTITHASMNSSTNQNAMTNGSVSSVDHNMMGGKRLTVSYNGQQKQVWVPASAPIVKLEQASHSVLKNDAHAFIIAKKNNGHWVAKMVAVGKNGLKPPM